MNEQEIPSGTITFLFTDIEGSTKLLQRFKEQYTTILSEHQKIMRAAFLRWNGIEINTQGDAFFAAFQRATDALSAVVEIQRALVRHKWPLDEKVRVRMALHTGEATIKNGDYIGMDVHRAARICSAGHGGQVLLSKSTCSLVERDLPKGISLRDLGLHQLKDLRNPVHIFQLVFPDLPSSFPQLKSLQAHPNNLPIQPTRFVGREQEMEKVKESLNVGRLVTLIGIGGTGKTRLALEVAQDQLLNYQAGVYFVHLEPLSIVESIPLAIAEAIGFLFYSSSDPKEQLIDHLRQKQVLLILDNFEHLVDGAGFVSELLQAAPDVKIIATSREKLNLQGEILLHVDGMEYPKVVDNLEHVAESNAVNLFMQSAQRVSSGFKLEEQNFEFIVSICQMLEGIPLGILLAAAWVEILSPKEILDEIIRNLDFLETELRDVPERHRSIRAVFDTSWDQLTEIEREMLMKLSVFWGGFTREAAQAVARTSLRQLIGLVNKSLLWRNPVSGRFEFHSVLRQFASEKLKEVNKHDEARATHCSYYTEFMSQRLSRIRGSHQIDTLREIEIDFENIKQAWHWAVDHKNYSAIDRCSETLYVYCEWLNLYQEGEELFQNAREGLTPLLNEEPRPAWGRVLLPWYDLRTEGKGRLEDKKNIRADVKLSLATARNRDDRLTTAHNLVLLGAIAEDEGDHAQAIIFYEEGLTQFPDIGDSFWVTIRIGLCHRRLGQHKESFRAFQRSLERGRTLDDKIKIAWSLFNLGETLFMDSDPLDEALIVKIDNHWREANNLFYQVRSKVGIAWTTANLSMLSFLRQDFEEAKALSEETLRFTTEFSYATYGKNEALAMLGSVSVFEGDYSSGKQHLLHWLSTRPSMQQAMKSVAVYCRPAIMVVPLPSVALLLANEGKKEEAVVLLSLAYNHPASPKYFLNNWPSLRSFRTTLEAELSLNVYNSAWSRGRKLDFDKAIAQLMSNWN